MSRRCSSTASGTRRGQPGRPSTTSPPIDQCFRLVGIIRARWKGLSGGTEVWKDIAQFFAIAQGRGRREGGRGPCLTSSFAVEGASVVPYAMAPTLAFALRVTNAPAES